MLFVNEELEESKPVFSVPKKVQPKTDDDMVRRIKTMLGEYVHESELHVNESMESENMETEAAIFKSSEVVSKSYQENCDRKNTDENEVTSNRILPEVKELTKSFEKKADDKSILNNDETTDHHTDYAHDSVSDASSTNSRRCSLKRQCKERISLLDYNPMFTLRTKRIKVNPSSKGKPSENLDIPMLKKCPEVQVPDESSEVLNQDPPLLLDAMLTPFYNYSSPDRKKSLNDCSLGKLKEDYESKKDPNFHSDPSIQTQVKSKKRIKKRKKNKIMYESLPVSDVSTLPTCEDYDEHSVNSKIGSCEIRNGILKIRLSKLPNNKKGMKEKNYEVSYCETAALNGCKPLSVPLSPLAPDLYCTSYKKKNRSSSKIKRSVKKKCGKESLYEVKESSSINTVQDANVDSLNNDRKSNINELNQTLTNISNVNKTLHEDETKEFKTSEIIKEPLKECLKNDPAKNESFKFLESNHSFIEERSINNEKEQVCTPTLENEMNSMISINKPDNPDSKITCSIKLSMITRLPLIKDVSNYTNDQTISIQSDIAKEELLKKSSFTLKNNLSDSQVYDNFEKNSTDIKKEMSTSPSNHLNKNGFHNLETNNSPTALQEDHKNDVCPNLTPAYSFETPITENNFNKHTHDNLTEIQESSLCVAEKDSISNLTNGSSTKVPSVFSHNPHINKVKIEVPDSILSNHERWNEYKEYKWCRDFTDISYINESSLFKEKISYNMANHRLWQDPELKKQYSSEYYLIEAKKLKHQADKEIDRVIQAMKYLEAVLYFILTGNAMEHSYIETDRVHTMYKETLTLIRFISSKFQKLRHASCRNIDNKLTVLSLRCQSLLYLKMYQLRRDEVRYLHRNITTFLKPENEPFPEQVSPPHLQQPRQNMKHSQVSPSHEASPCSLTPSPAGSVASVSSQSSGYSSSEVGWSSTSTSNNFRAQCDIYSDAVTVSRNKYKMLQQQSAYLANLHLCHDLWEHADYLSSKEHSREFFLELDEECGCLSLHSPFSALVHYVRKGLYKLKDGT
ncbi:hypothetical protein CDAR_452781 [Caerostris darwini]|uniref:AF4/FMR2 family member lilli n=2 Tax=Caerostris TaxID=172845 RepID=A0AAV4SHB8_9ARAC|nr:hypothetical protein CDAR_452781 [Caerostris darwini]